MAEMLGKKYVFSRKPTPAYVSGPNPDWDLAEGRGGHLGRGAAATWKFASATSTRSTATARGSPLGGDGPATEMIRRVLTPRGDSMGTARYLLGIDNGGTITKAALYDAPWNGARGVEQSRSEMNLPASRARGERRGHPVGSQRSA